VPATDNRARTHVFLDSAKAVNSEIGAHSVKQVVQNLRTGQVGVEELPAPLLRDRGILVRTQTSLLSAGTERMVMKLAKKGLLGKAKERPDLVRKVLAKLHRDGFLATFQAVREKLDRDVPLGYSLCGNVTEVGSGAAEFSVGQRVACAGAGYASHAEINFVPRLLAAAVPDGVSTEAAAYATVGAIALQGIRNAELRVGETVVVLGLGLIGQLAVQLARASGCRVVGLDVAAERVKLAAAHGAELALTVGSENLKQALLAFTRGRGADAVLVAAATTSNTPLKMAAELARDRARLVMIGVTGMQIPRKLYYEKELSLIVSRSYGPGRYDPQYEEHGHDYPAGYVRWTEQRNIEAFLDLVAAGTVRPDVCTTHHFPIGEATDAFDLILTNREPHLGVILTYPEPPDDKLRLPSCRIELRSGVAKKPAGKVGISLLGAGNFARSVLLPNLAKLADVELEGIVSASGISARSTGKKFGFAYCASSPEEIFSDEQTAAVVIATPHSGHAAAVCQALAAGKTVFVEKPLAINIDQLRQVVAVLPAHPGRLMVGFNRRFAPLAAELKRFLAGCGPRSVVYRCNAGPAPEDHWLADPAQGGRIIGEACHFFDFFNFLTEASPRTVFATAIPGSPDDAAVTVTYADGSVCQLLYASSGPASFGKERVEVFAGGRAAVLEDFRRLELQSAGRSVRRKHWFAGDKGHAAELAAFVRAVGRGEALPVNAASLVETTLVSFATVESIRRGEPIEIAALQAVMTGQPVDN